MPRPAGGVHQRAGAVALLTLGVGCATIAGLDEFEAQDEDDDGQPIECVDGEQGEDETAIDCGGPDCKACEVGQTCEAARDCTTQLCDGTTGLCALNCADGVQNPNEAGIDCGGGCAGCPIGAGCEVPVDCITQVCNAGVCACNTYVVISEIRASGPAGASDEFVELYNPTDVPINLSQWRLDGRAHNAQNFIVRWIGTEVDQLAARGHFLIVGQTYSGATPANAVLNTGITDSSIIRINSGTEFQDSVCYCGKLEDCNDLALQQICEGYPVLLSTLVEGPAASIERLAGGAGGSCVDSGDNQSDFVVRPMANPEGAGSAPTP